MIFEFRVLEGLQGFVGLLFLDLAVNSTEVSVLCCQ